MQAEQRETQGRFRLQGRGEILEKLNTIQVMKCALRATCQSCPAGFESLLLGIDLEGERLLFKPSLQPQVNGALPQGGKVLFNAQLDGIQCMFSVENLKETDVEGRKVLAGPIPAALFWMQRRNSFRVIMPLSIPVWCQIAIQGELREFPLLDLSVSGMALRDDDMFFDESYAPGFRFDNCRLLLPDEVTVRLALEIRNKVPFPGGRPGKGQRVGCLFFDVSPSGSKSLQHFVYDVQLLEKRDAPW